MAANHEQEPTVAEVAGEPTLPDAPSVRSVAPTDAHSLLGHSTLTQTVALREEQSTRARGIVVNAAVISALAALGLQLPEREAPGRLLATATCTVVAVLSTTLFIAVRKRPVFDHRWITALGFIITGAILTTAYHIGVFSPVILAGFIGTYYFGLSNSSRGAWAILVACGGGYGVLTLLATIGVVRLDLAVLPVVGAEPVALGIVAGVVMVMFAGTFALARYSRRATLDAMDRLERARRQIRQRDALLNEARADLDRAMDAGKIGRFTGQTLRRWIVDEVVGRGAMGEVYRARDVESQEAKALKILHPYLLGDPTQVERFLREARASGAVPSAHIVEVYESGQAPDGSPFLAMELLDGEDLAHKLRENRRLGVAATLELISHVSEGLSAAQEAGIVHRDLKPQNLFCDQRGGATTWKILDFGVATMGESSGTLTQGAAIGTPSYMAPEQAQGRPVDHRADIFALGVVAYRALTGKPPFTGGDALRTMYNVVHLQPARPSELVNVHEDVDRVFAIALAKSKDRRFSSALTFATALRDAVRGRLDERFRRDADEILALHPWGVDDSDVRLDALSS